MAVLWPWMLWIKAFHIMSMVAWMAGLFYLPRLFVYHCQVAVGSAESERFKVMEYKLLRMIMLPAMCSTFLFGGLLAIMPGLIDWHAGWWLTKLAAVFGLAGSMVHVHHGGAPLPRTAIFTMNVFTVWRTRFRPS